MDPGIRVSTNNDRTGQITAANPTITLDQTGATMVYVEGIQDGQSQLSLMQTAPGSSGTALQQVDSLSVYVFFATIGPQNVPNYSNYAYDVVNPPGTTFTPSMWTLRTAGFTGNVQGGQGQLQDPTAFGVGVLWGAGGANGVGQLSYTVNSNYTWSYYVNVVNITINSMAGVASSRRT